MTMSDPPIYDGHNTTDEDLIEAVRDALDQYTPIHIWGDGVQIDARGRTVTLSGVTRSRSAKETAGRIAQSVKGVSTVDNRLVVDPDVELAIAQALAADPRTRGAFPGILVGVVFGITFLKGTVPTAEMKAAAEEIARKIPGVKSVSNELAITQDAETAKAAPGKPTVAARPAS
jgi:osmotically-inducible protein OsmY